MVSDSQFLHDRLELTGIGVLKPYETPLFVSFLLLNLNSTRPHCCLSKSSEQRKLRHEVNSWVLINYDLRIFTQHTQEFCLKRVIFRVQVNLMDTNFLRRKHDVCVLKCTPDIHTLNLIS